MPIGQVQVLKRAKPADLPVVQATKGELHQSRDRQGVRHHVSTPLGRADEVIE
jgi:hypothetical protein